MKLVENLQAEQYFLAAIFKEPNLIKETSLTKEHFSELAHQVLFNAMKEIDSKGEIIDFVSVHTKLGNSGIFQLGGSDLLKNLTSYQVNTNHFKQYERYIIEAWQLSEAKSIVQKFINDMVDNKDKEILSSLVTELVRLEELGQQEQVFNLKETLYEMVDEAETAKGDIIGLDTGFTELNRMTEGNQKGDLIIVAGRPSMGKTAYALNLAKNHCISDAIVHIYSLEMTSKKLLNRIIASIGNIDLGKLNNPMKYFNETDWNNYTKAIGLVEKMGLFIFDTPMQTVPKMFATSRSLIRKYPNYDHCIMIDYLTLIKPTKKLNNRVEEVSEITRSLKIMARELNVPVIALAQLSRGVEQRQDKRPMMSDLRESGSIEQDADRIEFLYRDDYYNKESEIKNIVEIIIAKQRNGSIGTVELGYIKEFNKFLNLERRYDS